MTTNTAWFVTMLKQKRISQRKLAKEMGLDPAAISYTLRGKRKLQLTEAEQLAGILGVPLNDVLLAAGIEIVSRNESGGVQEVLRRLIQHSTSHAITLTNKGEIADAQKVMADITSAMTLLETIITNAKK